MNGILSILIFLAIGALAGWLAGKIMHAEGGLIYSIIIGIVGAFVGSLICSLFGWSTGFLTFTWQSILSAVVGACVVTFIFRLIRK